ncbi:MAG: hypothetical protein RIR76_506 [Verrucomicrobiota bacterium]|jgi:iron complex outermembrane receptor protein
MKTTPLCAAFASALLLIKPSILLAQGAAPAPASEVIELSPFEVTAEPTQGYVASQVTTGSRIRAEVKDLPFIVSVITSDLIADFDTIEFVDALATTASVSATDITPAAVHSRGFGSGGRLRDGMSFFGLLARSSIDRVEIIKGPFAAIYGKAAPGGVTNLVSKKPTAREHFSYSLSGGSLDYRRAMVSASGPLIKDKLMYRFDGGYYEIDGAQDFKRFEQAEYSASVLFRPKTGTSILLDWNYLDNLRSRGAPIMWERDPTTLQYTRKLTDRFFFNRDGPGGEYGVHFNWLYKSLGTTFEHRLNDTLTARIAGVWWERAQPSISLAGSAFVPPGSTIITGRHPTWGAINRDSYQVQADLLATFRTARVLHNGLLSFSWQTESEAQSSRQIPTALRSDANVNLNTTDMNNPVFFYPNPKLAPRLFTTLANDRAGEFEIKSVFYTHRMDLLNGRLKTFFGGRYDEVVNELIDRQTGLVTTVPAKDFSPQGGFNFAISPKVNFYASYSESYTPSTQVQSVTQALLPNETGRGVDLGFKWSLFDARLSLVTGIYSVELNDVLQSVFDEELGRSVLVPDGQEKADGVEVELNWQPTKGFQMLAGYGYTDHRLTKNPERPELVGKPAARGVAPYNFGVRAIYQFQNAALRGFSVRGSIRGQGKSLGEYGGGPYTRNGISYPNDNRVNIWQPAWEVVDVGAGYVWKKPARRWQHSLNLNLKNILNEEYSIGNWSPQDKFSWSLTYSVRM